jgi:ribonuclease HII
MRNHRERVKELSFELIAGIDDATKCPCIGSIFISGVIASPKVLRSWKKLGVKDSKLIAAKKRAKLEKIIKETAIGYATAEITPAMIDDKTYNLNDWEMLVVLHIIQELQKQSNLQTVLIDNWEVNADLFKKRFDSLTAKATIEPQFPHNITINTAQLLNLSLIAQHYADEHYIVVGAASILSKQASDRQYAEYKQQFGDFGSGSPADPKTRLFVWQHRHNPPYIIRKSWNTFSMLAPLEHIEDDPIYSRGTLKQKAQHIEQECE